MASYIVASCKEWHREDFTRFEKTCQGTWRYVAGREELGKALQDLAPRYIFFLHWNWIVPPSVWQRHECVCFHMTDVPYGRGGSPLQNLILNGNTETKLAALRMNAEMDAGPVYAKREVSLQGRAEEIYGRVGQVCWDMIRWMVNTEPEPVAQSGHVTTFVRRRPEQSHLPHTGSVNQLYDFIRMLDAPTYPLAFVQHGEFRLEFSHAELADEEIRANVVIKRREPRQ